MEVDIEETDGRCKIQISVVEKTFIGKFLSRIIRKKDKEGIKKLLNAFQIGDKIVFKGLIHKNQVLWLELEKEKEN